MPPDWSGSWSYHPGEQGRDAMLLITLMLLLLGACFSLCGGLVWFSEGVIKPESKS